MVIFRKATYETASSVVFVIISLTMISASRSACASREYVRNYGITNLRKYNLPDAWRLLYTIVGNEIEIISVLLEWLSHKEYERRFGYKSR